MWLGIISQKKLNFYLDVDLLMKLESAFRFDRFFIKYFSEFKVQQSSAKIFHDKILLPTVNFEGIPNTVVHRNSMTAITWPQFKQE